jgi:ribosomal protein L29
MSTSEFKGKNQKELLKVLAEKRNALQEFRLGNARSKTKDVKAGKNIRKDIARIMTEINAQVTA